MESSTAHWCNLVTYESLPPSHHAFFSHISQHTEPDTYQQAATNPDWILAMDKEL